MTYKAFRKGKLVKDGPVENTALTQEWYEGLIYGLGADYVEITYSDGTKIEQDLMDPDFMCEPW